jgi:hypothetical protein
MAMVAKKFGDKYSENLNEQQKTLLEKYTRAQVTGDNSEVEKYLDVESQRLYEIVKQADNAKEISSDKIMAERLTEARNILVKTKSEKNIETRIEEIMLFQKLAEEIES